MTTVPETTVPVDLTVAYSKRAVDETALASLAGLTFQKWAGHLKSLSRSDEHQRLKVDQGLTREVSFSSMLRASKISEELSESGDVRRSLAYNGTESVVEVDWFTVDKGALKATIKFEGQVHAEGGGQILDELLASISERAQKTGMTFKGIGWEEVLHVAISQGLFKDVDTQIVLGKAYTTYKESTQKSPTVLLADRGGVEIRRDEALVKITVTFERAREGACGREV